MKVSMWPEQRGAVLWGQGAETRIQLLGRFRVWIRDAPIPDRAWPLRKSRSLVKLLALVPGFRLHREQVMDALWPDLSPQAASQNLRVTLHAALRALGNGPADPRRLLDREGDILVLAPLSPACTDVESFEAAALAARRSDEPDPYHTALNLYLGELLPDDVYEECFAGRRQLLSDTYHEVLDGLIRLYEARGDYDAALVVIQEAFVRAPASETLYAHTMRLHTLAGRPDLALRRFESLVLALRRETAVEPSAETQALYEDIRSGRLGPPRAPQGAVSRRAETVDDPDAIPPRRLPEGFTHVVILGRFGHRSGEFNQPYDVDADEEGNLYVADHRNHRIQMLDAGGRFLRAWGTEGSGLGELRGPINVAVGSNGMVYVADCFNHRVQAFTTDGTIVRAWGDFGHGPGAFNFPTAIAVDPDGNVYVGDQVDSRIQQFSAQGEFIRAWGGLGTAPGRFNHVGGIAAGTGGYVYVADYVNHRVQQFAADGTFVRAWGRYGTADGEFRSAGGVAVDPAGDVYVSDVQNLRIQKFTSDGQFLCKWGRPGPAPAEFASPRGLATDATGSLYVCEVGNHRIQRFVAGPQVVMRALAGMATH